MTEDQLATLEGARAVLGQLQTELSHREYAGGDVDRAYFAGQAHRSAREAKRCILDLQETMRSALEDPLLTRRERAAAASIGDIAGVDP